MYVLSRGKLSCLIITKSSRTSRDIALWLEVREDEVSWELRGEAVFRKKREREREWKRGRREGNVWLKLNLWRGKSCPRDLKIPHILSLSLSLAFNFHFSNDSSRQLMRTVREEDYLKHEKTCLFTMDTDNTLSLIYLFLYWEKVFESAKRVFFI